MPGSIDIPGRPIIFCGDDLREKEGVKELGGVGGKEAVVEIYFMKL